MAVRTRSIGARAAIAAARISQSERERLQRAVDDIEASIKKYNKEKKYRSWRAQARGNWKRLFKGITTIASYASKVPGLQGIAAVAGGVGLAGTTIFASQEAKERSEYIKSAKRIDTGYAKPLESLLFAGEEARRVTEGAEDIRGQAIESGRIDKQKAILDFAINVGSSIVSAGQAGGLGGGTKEFLNKPLGEQYLTKPVEGASTLDKLSYDYMKSLQPSVGSLLGGVSPYEQELAASAVGNLKNIFSDPVLSDPVLPEVSMQDRPTLGSFTPNLYDYEYWQNKEVTGHAKPLYLRGRRQAQMGNIFGSNKPVSRMYTQPFFQQPIFNLTGLK